jgi:anti-anti-sigma factor
MTAATLTTRCPATADTPPVNPPWEQATLVATITVLDCGVLMAIEGEAGIAGVETLQGAFDQVIARRAPLAVLDFSRLTLLSSLALGQLFSLERDLKRWHGRVKIVNCPAAIREVFELSRLADFFEFHSSVEEALSARPLEFEVEEIERSVVVIRVRGEVTCDRTTALNEQLRSSLIPDRQFVILDLAESSVVGPLALQALAEFSREFSRQGGEVWLASLQPAVWLALHTARLDRLFVIRASMARALGKS